MSGLSVTNSPRPISSSVFRSKPPRCAPGWTHSRPRLHAFLQRIHARPAYRRALERGGKYDFGPKQ